MRTDFRMKLHWSPRSPFVRKVMVVAHETGTAGRLDCVRTVAATTKPNTELMADNPLSKLPTLVLDDGTALYDSPVICEYLDTLHAGPRLFPAESGARMIALRRQALGDGMLDFLVLWRAELMRPAEQRSAAHLESFAVRREGVLDSIESEVPALEASAYSIGHISLGCALSYLDFRFKDFDWRKSHTRAAAWHKAFVSRPAVEATEPVDDS
jgi:glutathione S-transferase